LHDVGIVSREGKPFRVKCTVKYEAHPRQIDFDSNGGTLSQTDRPVNGPRQSTINPKIEKTNAIHLYLSRFNHELGLFILN